MRQVSKGLLTAAATGGMLAMASTLAYADAGARGPAVNAAGVGSGNVVQAPVSVPVNVCGNTVGALGRLNLASGTKCGYASGGSGGSGGQGGGSSAGGVAGGSSGVGSGNVVQAPVHVPVNVCGNAVGVGGSGTPVSGGTCVNDDGPDQDGSRPGSPGQPGVPQRPGNPGQRQPSKPQQPSPSHRPSTEARHALPSGPEELAETGAGNLGMTAATSAGLLLCGALLYRRSRAGVFA
jgi:hypothetical protein